MGNGYVGAMVFGGVAEERISLNEGTLYSREPSVMFKDIKITSQRLEEVASMLRKGEYKQAYENIISKNALIIWLSFCHLWIVRRLFLIENTYILVFTKGLLFGV